MVGGKLGILMKGRSHWCWIDVGTCNVWVDLIIKNFISHSVIIKKKRKLKKRRL